MKFHVPYSEVPADEFRAPDGQWYSTLRAIAFDGWLLWKHALPVDLYLWPQLSPDVYETIQLLGRRMHVMHQMLPDYKRLDDTPFTVSRWWDPLDDTEDWDTGSRLLCKIKSYTASEVVQEVAWRCKSTLAFQQRSKHWLEVSLPK